MPPRRRTLRRMYGIKIRYLVNKMEKIKEKIKKDSEEGFRFDFSEDKNGKKRHNYFFNGKRMTGVTTILDVLAKPALIQWAANMAVNYIKEKAKWNDPFLTLEEYEKVLEEARKAHIIKKETAGQKGTDVHAEIEKLIKEAIEKTNGVIENWNGGKELGEKEKQIINFISWTQLNKVQFLASEKKVFSSKLFVAGCADFTCVIDEKKYIGDIKTSSGIYPEMFYQTAAYRMLLEEMGEKDFHGSLIVNIKKDGTFSQNDVQMRYDYESEKEGFLAALTIYRLKNNY